MYIPIWGQGWGWVWLPVCPYMPTSPYMCVLICPYMRTMMIMIRVTPVWGQGWGWVWLPVCPYMSVRAWPTVHSLPRYLVLSSHSFCSICKCICIHGMHLYVSICMCAHTCVCFLFVSPTCIYALTISSYPVILHSYPFLMCLCATAQPSLICHIVPLHFNNSSVILDLALL